MSKVRGRIKVKICFSLVSNMHTKSRLVRCYLHLCKTHVFISRGSNPKIINWNCILYKVDIVCTQFIYCLQQSIFGLHVNFSDMSPKLVQTYPNLSTYSRKLGNYNGILIFVIDNIMKKSSPSIKKFVKLDFFTSVLVVFVHTATLLRAFWFWQWQKCEF